MSNDWPQSEWMQWGHNQLLSLGYTLENRLPEKVLQTPWSHIIRFETTDGYLYLKHTPEALALEAAIIRLLQDQFHAPVPTVIAHSDALHCFLMKDAGRSFRAILKQQFNLDLFCKTVDQFTTLQIATSEHVDLFLNIGVPDWRLDKLPDLYKELLSHKELLIEDGLSDIEISELTTMLPQVHYLCQKLSDCSIKATIVQPDFNDNNTLIDEVSQAITIIDLGEIVISHPFFSLLNCLEQVKKHYGFSEQESSYQRIMDACLKNYRNFHSKESLLAALKWAKILDLVYGMVGQYRLMMACGKEKIMAFQPGRLSHSMKEFIKVVRRDPELNKGG